MADFSGPSVVVPFTGGLDTKTDPKMTPMGSLQILENGVFGEHGSIKKRPGHSSMAPVDDADAAIEGPVALAKWNDTPLLATEDRLYARSDQLGRWAEQGTIYPCNASTVTPPSVVGEQEAGDCCSNGTITVYAWQDSRGGVRASAVDTVSGYVYAHDIQIDANGERPKVGVSGGRVVIVWGNSAANELRSMDVQDGDPSASLNGSAHTFSTSWSGAGDILDVVRDNRNDRILVSYIDDDTGAGGGITVVDLGADGTVTRTAAFDIVVDYSVTLANMTTMSITSRPAASEGVQTYIAVLVLSTTGTSGVWLLLDEDLSLVGGSAYSPSTTGTTIVNIAVGFIGTEGTTLYSAVELSGGGNEWEDFILIDQVSGASGTLKHTLKHAQLSSSVGLVNGRAWFMASYISPGLQHTQFLYDLEDGAPVSRVNYGEVGSGQSVYLPSLWTNDGVTAEACGLLRRRISSIGLAFEPSETPSTISQFENLELSHTKFLMGSSANVQSVEAGGSTYLAAGTLLSFDGVSVSESAPLLFPELGDPATELVDDTPATHSDNLVSGSTYLYRFYYEKLRSNGETVRSLALTYRYTVGASDTNSVIILPTLSHALDGSADLYRIAVYRTEADKTDLFYQVTDADLTNVTNPNRYVPNDPSVNTIEFHDDMSDAVLITNSRDAQSEGVLPVVQPPACSVIGEANDRIFLAGGEGLPSVVYPSLIHFPGEPVLFSDELQFSVEEEGGDITALGAIDGVLIVFKERRIYAVSGDGPSDVGTGAGFNVRRVTTDVGCNAPGSVVETPKGLMFMSAKGVYILTRSFDTQYIGWPVESSNSSVVVSAQVIPDTNLVVFLTSGGSSLAYDHFFDKWATITNHFGLDAVVSGGEYHYLRSDGELYTRDESTYLDDGRWFSLRLRTAPIRLASVQDYLQVRSLTLLGEYLSSHRLQMKVFCNRDIVPFEVMVWEPDDVLDTSLWGDADTDLWGDEDLNLWGDSGDTDYQVQHKFQRQNVQSLRLEFEDLQTDGAPGQSYELAEMSFEIGTHEGPARIPAGRKW